MIGEKEGLARKGAMSTGNGYAGIRKGGRCSSIGDLRGRPDKQRRGNYAVRKLPV